jgi:hypothetical protein
MAAQDPNTREAWQDAVDLADGLLAVDSARTYGLITGGPDVDVARCAAILRRGRARGITPRDNAVELVAHALADQQTARP